MLFVNEQTPINSKTIGQIFDEQSGPYGDFSEESYSWKYLERPAFNKYIGDLYTPNTRVLDTGCGTGRVIKYLISRGIRPENIVGFDISGELLEKAKQNVPGVKLFQSSVDEFNLPSGSFDLVTSNMVVHCIDNEVFAKFLDRVYDVLVPGGIFFFVDTDPDYREDGRDPKNINKWLQMETPWGTTIPYFNKHPRDMLNLIDLHGFDLVSGWTFRPTKEGMVDWKNYIKYSSGSSRRMAGRFKKVSEDVKKRRINWKIPSLVS